MAFLPDAPLLADAEDSVPMRASMGELTINCARPKPRLLARDNVLGHTTSMVWLDDERLALSFETEHLGAKRGVQIREGDKLSSTRVWPGPSGPLQRGDASHLVASGDWFGGYLSTLAVLDAQSGERLHTLPLRPPFVIESPSCLVALPAQELKYVASGGARAPGGLAVSAGILAEAPELAALASACRGPIVVDLTSLQGRPLCEESPAHTSWDAIRELALSKGGILIAASDTALVGVVDGHIAWERDLALQAALEHGVQAICTHPDEERFGLATHTESGARFQIFEASSGSLQMEVSLGAEPICAMSWQRDGFVALGTSGGTMILVDESGQTRTWSACRGAIKSLTVSPDGGALYVGGVDKNIRAYPLLADESGTAITT